MIPTIPRGIDYTSPYTMIIGLIAFSKVEGRRFNELAV